MRDRSRTGTKVTIPIDSNKLKYTVKSVLFDGEMVNYGDIDVQHSMGIAGIGLPENLYMPVAKKLYERDSSIICPSQMGGACHSESYCAQLIDQVEDLHFKFEVTDSLYYQLPLTAFMRQQEDTCQFMVNNLGKS